MKAEKSTYVTGIAAAVTLLLLWIAGIYRLIGHALKVSLPTRLTRTRFATLMARCYQYVWRLLAPWEEGRLHICWMITATLVCFLSIFWNPINRLQLPATALILAVGWFGLFRSIERICCLLEFGVSRLVQRLRERQRSALVASLLLVGIWLPLMRYQADAIFDTWQKGAGYPFRESGQPWMETGAWIAEHLPGSITMTRNPWELHFYSQERAVQIPLASLKEIISTAKYYGATHLIPEARRPALNPWIQGEIPGLEEVANHRGLKLYAIHYDQLPEELRSIPPLDVLRRKTVVMR